MSASTHAAQGRPRLATPDPCVAFVAAWEAGRGRWLAYLGGLTDGHSSRKALARLGLLSTHLALLR